MAAAFVTGAGLGLRATGEAPRLGAARPPLPSVAPAPLRMVASAPVTTTYSGGLDRLSQQPYTISRSLFMPPPAVIAYVCCCFYFGGGEWVARVGLRATGGEEQRRMGDRGGDTLCGVALLLALVIPPVLGSWGMGVEDGRGDALAVELARLGYRGVVWPTPTNPGGGGIERFDMGWWAIGVCAL